MCEKSRRYSKMPGIGEEFYNTFYNAFTTEETPVTPKNATTMITESLNHDNIFGNHQRPRN
ncbi:hypothetical protein Hanom_Chr03g00209261 [Helianthus anomalus]